MNVQTQVLKPSHQFIAGVGAGKWGFLTIGPVRRGSAVSLKPLVWQSIEHSSSIDD
jgi:hypothetical protein